mmetsp:Transcript_38954/g.110292  ORF Transcript_38954/g.110292 Transcript_38954/m.110292 type:complete len:248 (+) Transcript_38954:2063-2806(+)
MDPKNFILQTLNLCHARRHDLGAVRIDCCGDNRVVPRVIRRVRGPGQVVVLARIWQQIRLQLRRQDHGLLSQLGVATFLLHHLLDGLVEPVDTELVRHRRHDLRDRLSRWAFVGGHVGRDQAREVESWGLRQVVRCRLWDQERIRRHREAEYRLDAGFQCHVPNEAGGVASEQSVVILGHQDGFVADEAQWGGKDVAQQDGALTDVGQRSASAFTQHGGRQAVEEEQWEQKRNGDCARAVLLHDAHL